MAMKAITVTVDEAVKDQAEIMLENIGLNMTTFINSSLKALVREKRIPFDLVTNDCLTEQMIMEKLAEAELEASNPNTKWYTHDEVFGQLQEKYGYEI